MQLTTLRQGTIITACLTIGVIGAAILAQQPSRAPSDVRSAAVSDDPFAEPPPVVNDAVIPEPPPVPPPPALPSGTVTITGKNDAGTHANDGTSVRLPEGSYRLTVSGCTRADARDAWTAAHLRVNYTNGDTLGTPVGIAWPNLGAFRTEKECVAAYAQSEQRIHSGTDDVTFWLADATPKDHAGTLKVAYAPVDAPTNVAVSLTCDHTDARNGDVVEVRGRAGAALARTPVAVALPTGGAPPMRYLVTTDREGAFTIHIPVAALATDVLAVDALWPVADERLAEPRVRCAIPVAGTIEGFRTGGTAYYRTGTPTRPIFSPEDPYASSRVRVNLSAIPPMGTAIGRLEYDTNPTGTATPKRAMRFYRITSDVDAPYVQSAMVRFTLLKPEVTKLAAPAANVVIVKFDAAKHRWIALATTTVANRGSMTVVEAPITAADLRDATFALMAKR